MKTTTSSASASSLAPGGVDLDGLLRRLHLPTIRRMYAELRTARKQTG